MPPDRNLRLSLVWRFDTLDGPMGEVWWTWVASDFQGNPVFRGLHFPTLGDCIADARKYGYVEPEEG